MRSLGSLRPIINDRLIVICIALALGVLLGASIDSLYISAVMERLYLWFGLASIFLALWPSIAILGVMYGSRLRYASLAASAALSLIFAAIAFSGKMLPSAPDSEESGGIVGRKLLDLIHEALPAFRDPRLDFLLCLALTYLALRLFWNCYDVSQHLDDIERAPGGREDKVEDDLQAVVTVPAAVGAGTWSFRRWRDWASGYVPGAPAILAGVLVVLLSGAGLWFSVREKSADICEQLNILQAQAAALATEADNVDDILSKVKPLGIERIPADAARDCKAKLSRTNDATPTGDEKIAEVSSEFAPQETPFTIARVKPAVPFANARGKLPYPVGGRLVLKFGEETAYGGFSKGIIWEARPAAQVVSPADGWIVYAGEFRTYGKLVIVNAGGGYHVLLAGLSDIGVGPGQFVLAAEPIGSLGRSPSDTEADTRNSQAGKEKPSKPVLYMEVRKDGHPMDPLPWFVERSEDAAEAGGSPEETMVDLAPRGSFEIVQKNALSERDYSKIVLDSEAARDLINKYRHEHGLKPLVLNSQLADAAKEHSRDLAKWDRISHYGSDGSNAWDRVKRNGYQPELAAENVGTGQVDLAEVLKGWKDSPGHNKNLLLADADEMGIALVVDGRSEFKAFWTLVLGTRMRASPNHQ